ncbi:MAG: radical SAM protein [Muribaculaceae bacterium]|nr:radical SAM protein [Muribaculaceae bacterium]
MNLEYKLKDNVILRSHIEDRGGILIRLNDGETLFLNDFGYKIIKIIEKTPYSINSIASTFYDSFDGIKNNDLEKDILLFLSSLVKENYIEKKSQSSGNSKSTLINLQIELTSACNERCIHCYLPNAVKDTSYSLNFDNLKKVIDDFTMLGGEQLTLTGGEPLLYPELHQLLKFCHEVEIKINLLSNLTLFNQKFIDSIIKHKYVDHIQVSLYSMKPSTHDYITKIRGSWEKTISSIHKLHENGIPVTIACPIMHENMHDISDIMEYTIKNDISFRASTCLLPKNNGDSSFSNQSALNQNEYKQIYESLISKFGQKAYNTLFKHSNRSERLCACPSYFISSGVCSTGVSSLAINSQGDVTPCPGWPTFVIGNIKKESLEDIWIKSSKLKLLKRLNQWKYFKDCLKCDDLDFCSICLRENTENSSGQILDINPKFCEMAKFSHKIFNKLNGFD